MREGQFVAGSGNRASRGKRHRRAGICGVALVVGLGAVLTTLGTPVVGAAPAPGPHAGPGNSHRPGSRRCPTADRPWLRAPRRWPRWTGPDRRWWSATGRATCGPFTWPTGRAPLAGPRTSPGVPIDSTPSATPDGGGTENVYVGAGNASQPNVGGYFAFNHAGGQLWGRNAQDPNGVHGVQASLAVGGLNGVNSVVAPLLGQDAYALDASNGATLPGWPFFTVDSGFTTPALADLTASGQTEVVQGGDSPGSWPTA